MLAKIKAYIRHWTSDPLLEETLRRNREALERKREEFRLAQEKVDSSSTAVAVNSDAA